MVDNLRVVAKLVLVPVLGAELGEFRPVAENGKRGSATNRRVEIFLTPMPAVMDTTVIPDPTEVPSAPVADPADVEPLK